MSSTPLWSFVATAICHLSASFQETVAVSGIVGLCRNDFPHKKSRLFPGKEKNSSLIKRAHVNIGAGIKRASSSVSNEVKCSGRNVKLRFSSVPVCLRFLHNALFRQRDNFDYF